MASASKQSNFGKSDSEFGATNYTNINDYEFLRHLGSGAYGMVQEVIHRPTGMKLALKQYEK